MEYLLWFFRPGDDGLNKVKSRVEFLLFLRWHGRGILLSNRNISLHTIKPYNVLRFQGQTLTQGTYNTHWSTIKYDVNLRDHSFIIYLLLSFSSIPSRNNCRVFSEWPEVINTTDRGRINDLFQQQQLSIKFREPEPSPAGCCYYLEEGTLKRRRGKLAVFETYKIQWGKSYVRCEE